MANKQVEILLKATDQFTDPTKKAELALAATKIQAESLNKAFDKLSKQNPSLSRDEARAAAVALENMSGAAGKAGKSFETSKQAASGLAQLIGIQLPESVTGFLSKTSSVGPVLAAAFTTVGVIGLIGAIGQLPALFEKLSASITGWDAAAKKAYDDFIESNTKARLAVLDLDIALNQALGKGAAQNLEAVDKLLVEVQRQLVTLAKEKEGVQVITGGGEVVTTHARTDEEINKSIASTEKLRNELLDKRIQLQKDASAQTIADQKSMTDFMVKLAGDAEEFHKRQAADRKKEFDDLAAVAQAAGDDVIKRQQDFNNLTAQGGQEVKDGLAESDRISKQIIKNYEDLVKLLQDAGDEFIKDEAARNAALLEFRNRTAAAAVEQSKADDAVNDARAKQIIDVFKKSEQAGRDFINHFADDVSRIFVDSIAHGKGFWQAFKDLGKTAIASLADTFLSTMIKGFLEPFAKKLGAMIFGSAIAGGAAGTAGGIGGGAAAGGATGGAFGISGASLAAFATNPFTIAAAAGVVGVTAFLKSQAHHEASTFVKTLQDPFGQDLEAILHSNESAADQLKEVNKSWLEFSKAAQLFAQGGSDEALVVKQAFDTLNPLIDSIRTDLTATAANIQAVTPAGPMTTIINLDGRTIARIVSPHFYALTRNENFQLIGAR